MLYISLFQNNFCQIIREMYNNALNAYISSMDNACIDDFVFESDILGTHRYSYFVRSAVINYIRHSTYLGVLAGKKIDNNITIFNNATTIAQVYQNKDYTSFHCKEGCVNFSADNRFRKLDGYMVDRIDSVSCHIIKNIYPVKTGDLYILECDKHRVNKASHMNYRAYIEHPDIKTRQDTLERTTIQVGENTDGVILDFRYPLSPLQAFFIAMSNIHSKLK
jgi:hypothetical protein